VWPLPPPGPLVLACEWSAFNIGEERAQVDAQLILDAPKHSVQIWPQGNG
jgi:hypothetical protein